MPTGGPGTYKFFIKADNQNQNWKILMTTISFHSPWISFVYYRPTMLAWLLAIFRPIFRDQWLFSHYTVAPNLSTLRRRRATAPRLTTLILPTLKPKQRPYWNVRFLVSPQHPRAPGTRGYDLLRDGSQDGAHSRTRHQETISSSSATSVFEQSKEDLSHTHRKFKGSI
ncbi:hypothetical protein K449DRAFT_433190 [Hypoxylon sp. EC38]|nr:hypothetical protein K449DRAFT_433190 [Hypoxylon sp. EC38]